MQSPLPSQSTQDSTLPNLPAAADPQVAPPTAADSPTCADQCVHVPEKHFLLSCQPSFWSPQCHFHTTFCKGGGAKQPPASCFCIPSPRATEPMEASDRKLCPPCCCENHVHRGHLEDALPVCCHPSQLLAEWEELHCDAQRAVTPPLTFPRLTSSISETCLDAKHLLPCCSLSFRSSMRDAGTMTVHPELRDVGVQAGDSVPPHVFPQIGLFNDSRDNAKGQKAAAAPRSPVKEVKWDAEGMTWEVYGASVDPEELGLAIQRHLELQIKETAKVSQQKTNASQKSRRKRSRMAGFISPACCVHPSESD